MSAMTTYISAALIGLLSLVTTAVARAEPVQPIVSITLNDKLYVFNERPRLAQVLAPVALLDNWYWPATKVFKLDTPEPEQQRQALLALISRLKMQAKPELAAALGQLATEIAGWQVAQRVSLKVDYDLARISLAHNPRFDAGRYQLMLTARPNSLLVNGALTQPTVVGHVGAGHLAVYLTQLDMSPAADKQRLWLIQPDGAVRQVIVQHWGRERVEAMPGAQLIVPFSSHFFTADLAELNQQLLALAVNRMY